MTNAERYRREAEKCHAWAERVVSPLDKEAWLKLAEDWLKLAEDAVRKEQFPR
jgi:hypothetical protein